MRNLIVVLALAVLGLAGCSTQISKDAEGAATAYNDFVATLEACSQNAAQCDKEKVWNAMDAQTKSLYLEAFAALIRIDRIIETYFDPIEHKYMKARTGVDILESANIREYRELFFHVFDPSKLSFDENTRSGAEVERGTAQNANVVLLQTHQSTQQFTMIREDDGVWRTTGLLDASAYALEPIFISESAMKEFAKENLETEIKRRTAVRDYFVVQQETQRRLHNM